MERAIWMIVGAGLLGSLWIGLGHAVDVAEPPPPNPRLKCRTFPMPLDGTVFDTLDLDSPPGRWVDEMQDEGWRLDHLDFEVGTKSTGYAQGYAAVCVSPA